MKILLSALAGLCLSFNVYGAVFDYTITGTLGNDFFARITEDGQPDAFADFLQVSNQTEDLLDSLGGLPFILTFSQDTSVAASNIFGESVSYGNAITDISLTLDGSLVDTGTLGNFFASTSISTQHQWSFFGGGSTGQIDPILDDGDVFADYEFERDGEFVGSFIELEWAGIDVVGLDKDLQLFSNLPPENAPYFNDSFEGSADSLFVELNWIGFDQIDDGTGNPVDIEVAVSLSGLVTDYTSTAVVPIPAPIWMLGSALFGLLASRRDRL